MWGLEFEHNIVVLFVRVWECGRVFICTVHVPLYVPHGMNGMVLSSPATVLTCSYCSGKVSND